MSCNCNQPTNYNICNPAPCQEPQDCSCPTILKTDCSTYSGDDLECSGIKKGTILTELIQQLDAFICEKVNDITNALTLKNIGLGAKIYKGVDFLGRKELRTIIAVGDLVTVTENPNDLTIDIDEEDLGDFVVENQLTYSTANVGVGASVYKDSTTVGNNTQFNHKKLKSTGGTVIITEETNEINFEVETGTPTDVNITAGANVIVTEPTPNNFVIASTTVASLLENSATTTITGDGTLGNEYQVDVNNLQKVIDTFPYLLVDGDDKYTIFIDNGVANVVINVPDTLVDNFSVAFVQKGTGDVTVTPTGTSVINTPLGYKIKGQYYWALLEKELATVTHYLIGNTKL